MSFKADVFWAQIELNMMYFCYFKRLLDALKANCQLQSRRRHKWFQQKAGADDGNEDV